ncbi:hypothetical protein [Asanoa iriomotensis]|uniref:Uncharacterized protein n=1 Tax=Asanoa iriomotensis TaxID=234613 RepID=A0ABQ4CBP9_9ACTN|nr:hypothetical protein [Asanoa iriomotensis]GIF60200.1 hypothetical protein Air01nite_62950 [Asanoa iriomotensis]
MTGTGAESESGATPEGPTPGGPPAPAAHLPVAPWDPTAGRDGPGGGPTILAATLIAALLAVCIGGSVTGFLVLRRSSGETAAPGPAAPLSGPATSGSPAVAASPVEEGPLPSTYAPVDGRDLEKVCDQEAYFPLSPKRAGKPPHPVALMRAGGPGDTRFQDQTYYYDLGLSKSVEQTWAPESLEKVQLVACLDRVSAGSTIRRCTFDDPAPDTLPLVRATWRLHVYEIATGRKLLDRTLAGDDQSCPYVVLVGADRKLYAKVSDRAVIAALRGLVTR